jgi:hypothetical protein
MSKLTASKLGTIRAGSKVITLEDGNGLRFRVQPSGSKQWIFRRMVDGKRVETGLGGYPAVSLNEARAKAANLRAGINLPALVAKTPVLAIDATRADIAATVATFEATAREYWEMHKGTWKARNGAKD